MLIGIDEPKLLLGYARLQNVRLGVSTWAAPNVRQDALRQTLQSRGCMLDGNKVEELPEDSRTCDSCGTF
jgi:hypothetical protein